MISKACVVYVVLCCVLVSVLAVKGYTDKNDDINLQEILGNESLLQSYTNCILDKGKCSPEGKGFKERIQDALETGCEKCTTLQLSETTTMIDRLIKKDFGIWKELTDKLDPKGIWKTKYEDHARENGIDVHVD